MYPNTLLMEMETSTTITVDSMGIPQNSDNISTYDPDILLLGIYSSQIKSTYETVLSHPLAARSGKMVVQISKKRKFVADGIFKAELNEFLTQELAEDGYSGVEVRVTPTRTEIIILATRTQNVLGEKGR